MPLAYLKLARPKDWLKNIFVLLPFPFAMADGATADLQTVAIGIAGFSLVSSAVYSFNDARDVERDRLHEKKKNRPIAAGLISVPAAYIFAIVLALTGLFLAYTTGITRALELCVVYLGLQFFYTLAGKHIPLVDVFLLSSGFLIRVLLGCALLGVIASNWLLLCGSGLALFLGLAKRRGDLVKGLDEIHRPVLAGYNLHFLEHAMAIACGMTLFGYALYTMESRVLVQDREFASLPLVVFCMLDYLRVAHVYKEGGSPVDLVMRSPVLAMAGVGWAIALAWSINWP